MRGIRIQSIHTGDNYDFMMTASVINVAEAKTFYQTLDGNDGDLDMTEALGTIAYNNVVHNFSFFSDSGSRSDRMLKVNNLKKFFHGKKTFFIHDDDMTHRWIGRCKILNVNHKANYSTFDIEFNCQPYAENIVSTTITKSLTTTYTNMDLTNTEDKPVTPTFTATAETYIKYGDSEWTISAGDWRLPITIASGGITIKAKGSGTLTAKYTTGVL